MAANRFRKPKYARRFDKKYDYAVQDHDLNGYPVDTVLALMSVWSRPRKRHHQNPPTSLQDEYLGAKRARRFLTNPPVNASKRRRLENKFKYQINKIKYLSKLFKTKEGVN